VDEFSTQMENTPYMKIRKGIWNCFWNRQEAVNSSHPGAACRVDTSRQERNFWGVVGTRFLCNMSDFLWRSYDVGLIGLLSWILICGYKSMQYVIWNTVNISVHCHNIIKFNLCVLGDEDLINSQNSLLLAFQCILYFSIGFMATIHPNYIDSAFCPDFAHVFVMILTAHCSYFSTPRWLVDNCDIISVFLL
jgi:hypothetical protein